MLVTIREAYGKKCCIGHQCMQWRWYRADDGTCISKGGEALGYCGLAGLPREPRWTVYDATVKTPAVP